MRMGLPGLFVGWSLVVMAPAVAQVTVNTGALDLLPAAPSQEPRRAVARPARPSPPPSPPRQAHSAVRPGTPAPNPAAAATAATAATTPKPVLPAVPPAIAALPPPAPVPPPRPQAAPVVPVSADAPGAASPMPGGVRVTFGAERQDLNPSTEAALRALAQRLRTDQATVNIYAYAEGTPDDPSTSRRLSLGRALAARAVLINEGVASTRIYPRSLGPASGDGNKDRVDVVIGAPGPPSSGSPGPTAAP